MRFSSSHSNPDFLYLNQNGEAENKKRSRDPFILADKISASVRFQNVIMIMVLQTKINLEYGSHTNIQSLYDQEISSLDLCELVCPCCRQKTILSLIPDFYSRYFFNSSEDIQSSQKIVITGVRCQCGCRHALFPEWICPFSSFSYPFLQALLSYYFEDAAENKSACAGKFTGISPLQKLKTRGRNVLLIRLLNS